MIHSQKHWTCQHSRYTCRPFSRPRIASRCWTILLRGRLSSSIHLLSSFPCSSTLAPMPDQRRWYAPMKCWAICQTRDSSHWWNLIWIKIHPKLKINTILHTWSRVKHTWSWGETWYESRLKIHPQLKINTILHTWSRGETHSKLGWNLILWIKIHPQLSVNTHTIVQ